jgi:hypothetical protein
MDSIVSYGPSLVILLLGCFLLLAAIVGGGLEIKELKIPKIEKTPRLLTALLGLSLMACGGFAGMISFMSPLLFAPAQMVPVPTEITANYAPDTQYIAVDNVRFVQDSGLSAEIKNAAATMIVQADKAEILANYYQDASYLQPYYAGYALQQMQQNIDYIRQSGYIQLDDLDLQNSYYVNMQMNNSVLTIDECEYWKTYWYDPATGNLVNETEWTLVPQTISIELVGDQAFITAISFYQNNAFCTQ